MNDFNNIYKNDVGSQKILIGTRKFACCGESTPNDHPHIYLTINKNDEISCPYCGTLYKLDKLVAHNETIPPDCHFN